VKNLEGAYKKAHDSLPDSTVILTEASLNDFLIQNTKEHKISILVFSDKSSPPITLRSLSADQPSQYSVGFLSGPTDQVLGHLGWSRAKGVPVAMGVFYDFGKQEEDKGVNWEPTPGAEGGVGFRVRILMPNP
jgi:hypothetical protein